MDGTEQALEQAYGPFVPGSTARARRVENAKRGLRTCWFCIEPFEPHIEVTPNGKVRKLGRGRWYCSRQCADTDRARRRREVAKQTDPGLLVLDLSRCRGCAA
jgi:hypothetical protein